MTDFVEVFIFPTDPQTPYHAIAWRGASVLDVVQYASLIEVANYCIHRELPVVCNDAGLRAQLLTLQVHAQELCTQVRS